MAYLTGSDNRNQNQSQEEREMNNPIVLSTTDYSQFCFDEANRIVDPSHIATLVDAISEKNLLANRPINVTADGVVLDGQTRLLAARELGVPIYYIVATDMTIDDVPGLNGVIKSWKDRDFLRLYCAKGNEEYLFVKQISEKYPQFKLSLIKDLLAYGDRATMHKIWRNGLFQAVRRRFTVVVLDGARDFAPYVQWWNETRFCQSLASLFDTTGYSHERMLRKVKRLTGRMMQQVCVDDYLQMLTGIYNFQQSPDTHITFKNRSHTRQRQSYGDDLERDGDEENDVEDETE